MCSVYFYNIMENHHEREREEQHEELFEIIEQGWNNVYKEDVIIRECTADEILKLKPLCNEAGLLNNRVVAGGFAAWVAGRTTTYNDIDLFRRGIAYAMFHGNVNYDNSSSHILRIQNNGQYQVMTVKYDGPLAVTDRRMKELLLTFILKKFDMPVCRIGYFYDTANKNFVCVELYQMLNNKQVLKLIPERMERYNRRMKTPNSLQWLSATACKKQKISLFKDFIKSINIIILP